ncbi:MAG: hypothetical protein J7L38_03110 [Thermoproteales archaeon]|nr:hypothetical protein [Thermoproteales archaeon]
MSDSGELEGMLNYLQNTMKDPTRTGKIPWGRLLEVKNSTRIVLESGFQPKIRNPPLFQWKITAQNSFTYILSSLIEEEGKEISSGGDEPRARAYRHP